MWLYRTVRSSLYVMLPITSLRQSRPSRSGSLRRTGAASWEVASAFGRLWDFSFALALEASPCHKLVFASNDAEVARVLAGCRDRAHSRNPAAVAWTPLYRRACMGCVSRNGQTSPGR